MTWLLARARHRFRCEFTDDANDLQRFLKIDDLVPEALDFAAQGSVMLIETALGGIELLQPLLSLSLGAVAQGRSFDLGFFRGLLQGHDRLLVLGIVAALLIELDAQLLDLFGQRLVLFGGAGFLLS